MIGQLTDVRTQAQVCAATKTAYILFGIRKGMEQVSTTVLNKTPIQRLVKGNPFQTLAGIHR
jgi:hypothetical protein